MVQSRNMLSLAVIGSALFAGLALSQSSSCPNLDNGVHVPGSIPTNPYEPLQHRLAYNTATGMTISWNTYIQLPNPTVAYGIDPLLDQHVVGNVSVTYPTSRTWNNHVQLSGLEPNTKYYYRVSYTNCANCAYLPTYTFTTARTPGDESPFTVAIVVDMGLMGSSGLSTRLAPTGEANPLGMNDTNTIQSLLAFKDTYDFLGHWGDIAYADYAVKESYQGYLGSLRSDIVPPTKEAIANLYESFLEQYFDQMTPITSTKPYMVAPGNHEANCDNGGTNDKANHIKYTVDNCTMGQTNFTGYINHFRMPSEASGGKGNFWYSFDHGMAHFVVLDTETDLGHGLVAPDEPGGSGTEDSGPFGSYLDQQVDWLTKDLKNVDRSKTPWVIVGLHRPWYISTTGVDPGPQKAFEKIFYEGEVDMYLTGHQHVYQRNKPVYNFTIDPNGLNNPRAPWPITNGAAGHYDGLDTLDPPAPYSAVQFADAYGWSRLTFHNRTHLTHEFVSSANGSVLDSATLYKAHAISPAAPVTSLIASVTQAVASVVQLLPSLGARRSIDLEL